MYQNKLTFNAWCSPNGSKSSINCFQVSCHPRCHSELINVWKVRLKSVHSGEVRKFATPLFPQSLQLKIFLINLYASLPSRNFMDSPEESVISALKYRYDNQRLEYRSTHRPSIHILLLKEIFCL